MMSSKEPWHYREAEWYQFWLPQSGFSGGLILGAILGVVLLIVLGIIK
jgi:hypothetical protein